MKVVNGTNLINMDANGLSKNSYPRQKDSTGSRWHIRENKEDVFGCHASLCLSLLTTSGDSSEDINHNNPPLIDKLF